MLVEFRVANFLSFKEEQVLSMVASSDRSHPENVAEVAGFRLLKAAAIYGPNAAGKSNLIKALQFAGSLVRDSDDVPVGGRIPRKPFLLDPGCSTEPSAFGITFVEGGVRYEYDFAVTSTRVVREELTVYPGGSKGRGQTWFSREFEEHSGQYNWSFSSHLTGEKNRIRELTRDNVLYLTMAAKLNHGQIARLFKWFSRLTQLDDSGGSSWSEIAARFLWKRKGEGDDKLQHAVEELLQKADVGIREVRVVRDPSGQRWKAPLRVPLYGEASSGPQEYRVLLRHESQESGQSIELELSDESEGTQRLFEMAIPWYHYQFSGCTVFLDEFERSLHPSICAELLRAWQDAEHALDRDSVQLIFTTHNTLLLDSDLLRRDQVWFVEKDRNGASHLYPLTDYSPRKNESLGKGYLSGRYGAIPFVGDPAAAE